MIPTPEHIYQEFHKQTFFYSKGFYPKAVKNFSVAKESDDWIYFQRFADKIDQTDGLINYKLFVESLAHHYTGWFTPNILLSLKGIKIYKTYKSILNTTNDSDLIYSGIGRSIKEIVEFCKENNIKSFDEYFDHNRYAIPTVLKHIYSGTMSHYTVLLINKYEDRLRGFPVDMLNEYAEDFNMNKEVNNSKLIKIARCRKLSGKVEKIINNEINKVRDDKTYGTDLHTSL